jgi:predicted Zn finger-like uncharacterized protein
VKVTCSRCGTEYNFDDSKVTEEGVKVKCTRCENVFRVRKKAFVLTEPVNPDTKGVVPAPSSAEPEKTGGGSEPSQPSSPGLGGSQPGDRRWMIRKKGGETLEFAEMTTLQRWIVERAVARDDEISHNGVKWKKLGTIPELAPFFSVFETTNPGGVSPAPDTEPHPGAPPQPKPKPNDAAERQATAASRKAAGRGRGVGIFALIPLLLIGGLAAFAQLTAQGRAMSAPAREWLLAKTGVDLRLPSATPTVEPTATPTAVAAASPSPEQTQIAAASPTPAPSAAASPVPSPTAIAKASPVIHHTANVEELLNQGFALYSKGRYKEAILKYQAAVNAAPENSEAYALLGLAYLEDGQDDLAESTLEASVRLNANFADAHRYLGMLYSKRGDKTRAIAAFNTYLDLRPNGPTSDEVRKRVATLQGG